MRSPLQLTDKDSGCCELPGTVATMSRSTPSVGCTATADPSLGSTCAVTTTADAFIPGMVREGSARVWELRGPVRVYDDGTEATGADADALRHAGSRVPCPSS